MNPGKLIGGLVGVFIALAGPLALAGAGYWWAMDRPAWHVGWCPVCLGWKPGAAVQIATIRAQEAAWAAALRQSQANTATLQAALNRQNSSLTALAALGAQHTAEAKKAAQALRSAQEQAIAERDALLAKPLAGSDALARYEAVHQSFSETLK